MTELKPCPFCGGRPIILNAPWAKYRGDYMKQVHCKSTHCVTLGLFRDEEEAIEAWNTRAERTCKPKPGNLQGIVVCECGDPFPEYYEYCPYCGAKVVE